MNLAWQVNLKDPSHKITSPIFKPWSATKVIVTDTDPSVVANALVKVDVALIGRVSQKIPYVVIDKNYHINIIQFGVV